jgi:hypothetical protein
MRDADVARDRRLGDRVLQDLDLADGAQPVSVPLASMTARPAES